MVRVSTSRLNSQNHSGGMDMPLEKVLELDFACDHVLVHSVVHEEAHATRRIVEEFHEVARLS